MPNQLKHARSPYLRQHENNPVHWHEWNEETLELAKKSNKLILVSIGYSAAIGVMLWLMKVLKTKQPPK